MSCRVVNALIQFGSILVLARLLSPADFGLVAMVTAISGSASVLVSLGTPDAVVQRTRITEAEVSALFWITSGLGLGATLVMAACGPLLAWFYGEPRLTMVTVVCAFTFVAAGLGCQHYALLRRAMKFEELGIIEVHANLLSVALAVAMAYYEFQYWALVLKPVTLNALLVVGVWIRCRWLPPKPVLTPGVKEILRFGVNLTGFTFTDFVGGASDRIALGYRSGAMALGHYQNALSLYSYLLDVSVSPLHGVAVASLSKVRGDLEELQRLWGKALSTLGFYAMPVFGILAVISQDLVALLLGAKWEAAGVLLSILALRGIPNTIERTSGWLHVTAGRTDRWMRWGIFTTCAHMLALFAGLPFGATGVVVAFVVCMFALFVPAIAYAGRPLAIGARDVISIVWRPLAGSLMAAALGFVLRYTLLNDTSEIVRMAVLTLAYLVVYGVMVVGLLRVRVPLLVALLLVRDFLPAWVARRIRMQRLG